MSEWTNRFPNLVRLRRGDVVQVFGRRQVVVLVSDCCARVITEQPPGKRHVVTRFGAEFDVREEDKVESIATYEPPEVLLERHNNQWLEEFLAQRRQRTTTKEKQTTTNENERTESMPRDRRKDRGGLAATAETTTAPRVRRSRKAKPAAEANGETKPRSKGALGQLMGHSVCSVLMRLGMNGVNKAWAVAIMKAQGVKVAEGTIGRNIAIGRGILSGENKEAALHKPAELSQDQIKELKGSAEEPKAAPEETAAK